MRTVKDRRGSEVLNALRQSEENHQDGVGSWVRIGSVLNALRQSEENHGITKGPDAGYKLSAQRLTAIRGKSPFLLLPSSCFSRCSTPYGNQRKITVSPHGFLSTPVCAQRLTAIRGKSRTTRGSIATTTGTCSTPYGNQRKITGLQCHLRAQTLRAQRLTAIRGKSQWYPGCNIREPVVLNALRQSEENHTRSRMGRK